MEKKLINLFVATFADLDKLETAEREGLAAIASFGTSSENLLKGILKTETWVFGEDRKVYDEVKKSVLAYAKSVGKTPEIAGSIAGGKFRAEARKSDDRFVRLAGRLAGRLSTLISNAKKAAAEKTNKGKTTSKTSDKGDKGKTTSKTSDKGDKVAKAWEEGVALGRGLLACEILEAFPKNKELEKFIKANVSANELAAARERRANDAADAANAATKKAA